MLLHGISGGTGQPGRGQGVRMQGEFTLEVFLVFIHRQVLSPVENRDQIQFFQSETKPNWIQTNSLLKNINVIRCSWDWARRRKKVKLCEHWFYASNCYKMWSNFHLRLNNRCTQSDKHKLRISFLYIYSHSCTFIMSYPGSIEWLSISTSGLNSSPHQHPHPSPRLPESWSRRPPCSCSHVLLASLNQRKRSVYILRQRL